jgi:hypothetical protein
MARARKKTKRARRRPAKRRNASQQGSGWTLGVAILGITPAITGNAFADQKHSCRVAIFGQEKERPFAKCGRLFPVG